MSLSPQEKETLQFAIDKLEQKLSEDAVASEGIGQSISDIEKEDSIYKKIWLQHHLWILNYEREIEGLNGEYIAAPFSYIDLIEHAENRGRMYQGTVSSDPKIIPEMVGGGIAASPKANNENNALNPDLDALIDLLVNGISPSGTSTVGDSGYTAGATQIVCSSALSPNTWYLVGNDVIMKIGGVTEIPAGGSCSLPEFTTQITCIAGGGIWEETEASWIGTVEKVYGDNNVSAGASMTGWTGYSNTERTSKTATSTTQRLMDALIADLNTYIDIWLVALNKTKSAVNRNDAPNMSIPDRTTTNDDFDYITDYRASTPIQDGDPGIDGLSNKIASRKSFISTRPTTIKNAKKEYYGQRTTYTKMRCNIQNGSLTKILYFEELQSDFPAGGSPEEQKRLNDMKALLA